MASGAQVATCGPFMGHDWAVQLGGCAAIDMVQRISHCDSGEDCARGEVCCTDYTGEIEVISLCKPLPATGESPCTEQQRCLVDGKRCSQRNTVCRQGRCMRSDVSVDCGKAGRCRGAKPLCCVNKGVPRCTSPEDCSGDWASGTIQLECDSGKDCLRGQQCCRYVIDNATCTGFCAYGHGTFACQTDGDCPTKDPAWPHCVHEPGVINGKCSESKP